MTSPTDIATTQQAVLPGPSPLRLFDYWSIYFLRTWRAGVASALVTPILYVIAMGVVLGDFIPDDPSRLEGAADYLAFVGPGLLASQVMVSAFGDTTWPVMGMVKWDRTYLAMIATPLRVRDVVLAHLGFVMFRVGVISVLFTAVLAIFGVFDTWYGALLVIPVQLLVGAAFAGLVYTITTVTLSEAVNSLMFRVVMMPLFLFSGAFFPVSNLGDVLEWVARVTPLWHGVDLTRMLGTGEFDASRALVHVVYLAALAVIGTLAAVRAMERRLLR